MDTQGNVTALVAPPTQPVPRPALGAALPTAIVPTTLDEVYRLATAVAKSGLAPYGMRTPEQITVAILTGLEMGIKPMQAVNGIAVISGKPSIYGDLQMAVVRASGELEIFKETFEGEEPEDWTKPEGSSRKFKAVCRLKRRGQPDEVVSEFSIADAQVAKLWMKKGRDGQDTPWVTNPKRMLRHRARSFALRDTFADALRGMASAEEMMDVELARETREIEDVPSRIIPPKPPVPPTPESPAIEQKQPETAKVEEQAPTPSQTETPASEAPDTITVTQWEEVEHAEPPTDDIRDFDPSEFLAEFDAILGEVTTVAGVRRAAEKMNAGSQLAGYDDELALARQIFTKHLSRVMNKPEAPAAADPAPQGEPLDYTAKPSTGDDYYAFAKLVAASPPPEGKLKWWLAGDAHRKTLEPSLGFKRSRELAVLFGATKEAAP